jgi:hypothetical protein
MSGKKKIDGASVSSGNWGGARPNSGRTKIYRDKYEANHSKDTKYRVVYKLANDYVGSTNNLHRRLLEHKSVGVNPVKGVQVLFASYNKKEALRVERAYHAEGYLGGLKKN